MTTITIPYSTPAAVVAKLEAALDDTAATDPMWNGAEFDIERSDFTSIDCNNEIDGTALLIEVVYPIIENQ